MSKALRIQKTSPFTSVGNFHSLNVNTALNQSAYRIHKCHIIKTICSTVDKLYGPGYVFAHSS